MKKVLLSLPILCLSVASAAYADHVSDFYFQQVVQRYFEYPQNARSFGMAGSSVVTNSDSSSVIGNPAGLGWMKEGEFSGTYGYNRISGGEFPTGARIDQRTNEGSGLIAIPVGAQIGALPEYGNLGLGWTTRNGTWRKDSFDTETETTQVVGAYAIPVSNDMTVGYSFGWNDDRLQSHAIFDYPMNDGFRHTLGAQWKVDDMIIGANAMVGHGEHHALFGPGITGHSRTLEEGVDLGVQYKLRPTTLLAISADYRHLGSNGDVESSIPANFVGGDENGNIYDARIGIEHAIDDRSQVRFGYRFAGLAHYAYNRAELNDLNGSAYYNAFTAGFGYRIPVASDYIRSINLDYGVEYRDIGRDDWQHVVSVVVPFNVCQLR